MLTNGPVLRCSFPGDKHGRLHEYDAQMIAKPDGTPVTGALKQKVYICEIHYPDADDPEFKLCRCGLCLARMRA